VNDKQGSTRKLFRKAGGNHWKRQDLENGMESREQDIEGMTARDPGKKCSRGCKRIGNGTEDRIGSTYDMSK